MGAIPNARKEMFARLIATGGQTQLECYVQAGYSENSGASAASNLARDPIILERVKELLELRQDRGIIPENEIDIDEIVTGDKIDEEWVLRQLQELSRKARDLGQLKVARDAITDIASIKGIGEQNKSSGEVTKNDGVPRIGKVDLTIIATKLTEARSNLAELLEEAIDITEKPKQLPNISDADIESITESAGDSGLEGDDERLLHGETS